MVHLVRPVPHLVPRFKDSINETKLGKKNYGTNALFAHNRFSFQHRKLGPESAVQGALYALWISDALGFPRVIVFLQVMFLMYHVYPGYQSFCNEALVWRQLKHPNILPFLGVNTELFEPSFCLISPWMSNKDIVTFLKRNPTHNLHTTVSLIPFQTLKIWFVCNLALWNCFGFALFTLPWASYSTWGSQRSTSWFIIGPAAIGLI